MMMMTTMAMARDFLFYSVFPSMRLQQNADVADAATFKDSK